MQPQELDTVMEKAKKRYIDFYLEDDMFEISGLCYEKNHEYYVTKLSAVDHILHITGPEIRVNVGLKRLSATREDQEKTFEMELNRVYDKIKDPQAEDFQRHFSTGVYQFFQKDTDTLVWYDVEEKAWYIELNKINMYFSGERKKYPTLEALFNENQSQLKGIWQALHYVAQVDGDIV